MGASGYPRLPPVAVRLCVHRGHCFGGHAVPASVGNVEKYLEEACIDNKCTDGGSIIAMDPRNGDILAMANYPAYNLNTPYEPYTDELKQIWDTLEQKDKTRDNNGG